MAQMPEGYELQRQVQTVVEQRKSHANRPRAIELGRGRNLAYASLVEEAIPCVFTGEDVGRGTFYIAIQNSST